MIVAGIIIAALVIGFALGLFAADWMLNSAGQPHNVALEHLRNAEKCAARDWSRDARLEIQRAIRALGGSA